MKVPAYNPRPSTKRDEETNILEAVYRVVSSGRYILGPELEALEHEVEFYLDVKHAVGVGSGGDALLFGLEALGVGPRHEVITSAFTFAATALPILRLGATPVFCDIDPETFNLDPARLDGLVTKRTRAIVPVHLFGLMADMRAINEIAERHRIPVVEDACQAFGAEIDAVRAGAWGVAAAFSFYPTKPLGGIGDGGMLVTNDDTIADRARTLRNLGLTPGNEKYGDRVVGYKSRLDEIQAAVLHTKFRKIDALETERRVIADYYDKTLQEQPEVIVPSYGESHKHVFHQYTIRLSEDRRDDIRRELVDRGVGASVYYPRPLPDLRPFLASKGSSTQALRASREVLSLPIWPGMTQAETEMVTDELRSVLTL